MTYFEQLAEGIDIPCELKLPAKPPDWLDKDKYQRGRQFFLDFPFSVLMSNFRNLVIGLSIPNLCDALVLTQKSETKGKAFKRYVDTGYFMVRWLMGPAPWEDPMYFQMVNKYHSDAAAKLNAMDKQQRSEAAKARIKELSSDEKMSLDDPLDLELLVNLQEHKERLKYESFKVYDKYVKSDVIFSQFDMAMVQIAFFGSLVVFPRKFGAAQCSDDALDSFLHLWRVIGYYLGVSDIFNPVKSTLAETRKLLLEIGEQLIIPSVIDLNATSVHMSKCVTTAYNADYHVLLYSHCLSHGFELKRLWAKFTLKQKLVYYWRLILVEWIYAVPLFRLIINKIILILINRLHSKRKK